MPRGGEREEGSPLRRARVGFVLDPAGGLEGQQRHERHGDSHLLASHYGDFAKLLADYADWMGGQGVPLFGISVQNEPDYPSSWDGCGWSGSQMVTFIRDNLGPLLAQRGFKGTVILPETAVWGNVSGFADPLFADSKAKGYVGVIATHPYGGGSLTYSAPRDNGKEFWQTETSQEGNAADATMTSALTMAALLQDHVITAQMNAWHYWATIGPATLDDPLRQNPALIQNGDTSSAATSSANGPSSFAPVFGEWARPSCPPRAFA